MRCFAHHAVRGGAMPLRGHESMCLWPVCPVARVRVPQLVLCNDCFLLCKRRDHGDDVVVFEVQ